MGFPVVRFLNVVKFDQLVKCTLKPPNQYETVGKWFKWPLYVRDLRTTEPVRNPNFGFLKRYAEIFEPLNRSEFLKGDEGIHGPLNLSEFAKEDAGIYEPPNQFGRIWAILRNILIILFTISTATCDLHSKHCNYDVMITLSFFYNVIKTLSLRDRWMSHNMLCICYMIHFTDLCYMSHCDYDVIIFLLCNHYVIKS